MLFANAFITDASCSYSEVKSLCVINTAMTRAWEMHVEWLTDWLTDRVTDYLTDWLTILLVSWLTETINWQIRIFAKVALLWISYFIGNHGHRWRKFNTSICKQREYGSPGPPPEFPTLNSRRVSSLKNHWYVDIVQRLEDLSWSYQTMEVEYAFLEKLMAEQKEDLKKAQSWNNRLRNQQRAKIAH